MGVRGKKMGWGKKENGVVSLDKENNTELFRMFLQIHHGPLLYDPFCM